MSKDRQPLLNEGKLVKLKSKDMQNVLYLEIISYTFNEVPIVIFTHKQATNSSTHFSMRTPSTNNNIIIIIAKRNKKVRALLLILFLSTHSVFPFSFYLAHFTFLFLSLNPRSGKRNQNLKSDT